MARTGLAFDEACIKHDQGRGHPERPERLRAIKRALDESGMDLTPLKVSKASREDVQCIHTEDHVKTIERTCRDHLPYPDPDTQMGPDSWEAALLAAGSGIAACKAVLAGDVANAFCAVRPPGHHAESDRAMGFCLFNNVAIAARWLRNEAGIGKVAIVDWDVHHGNGTQFSLYDDDTIYYLSIHQHPHYPGTGFPHERGKNNTNLNIQMPPGEGPEEWLAAVSERILPELATFQPAFLLISAGFDAHKNDPLGGQRLEPETFAEMTWALKDVAGGKMVSILEGGYDLDGLAESAKLHVRALAEIVG